MMPKQADPQEHRREHSETSTWMVADTHHLPTDLSELALQLQIGSADGERLRQLADEAVARFESDDAATVWFESEVRTRYPNLWWSIRQWITRRGLSESK